MDDLQVPFDWPRVVVLGDDQEGPPCPGCGGPTVRRTYLGTKDEVPYVGQQDFCRACVIV